MGCCENVKGSSLLLLLHFFYYKLIRVCSKNGKGSDVSFPEEVILESKSEGSIRVKMKSGVGGKRV